MPIAWSASGSRSSRCKELVAVDDDGQLDAEGIELAGVFSAVWPCVVDDAPALFAGDAAVAGPEAAARARRDPSLEARLPLATGAAAGHDGPQVDLGQALAGLGHRVEHRAGRLLDRRLFEVARLLFVVRRHRGGVRPRDVDLLGRAGRSLGTAAAAAEHLDDLQRRRHPRGVRLVGSVDQAPASPRPGSHRETTAIRNDVTWSYFDSPQHLGLELVVGVSRLGLAIPLRLHRGDAPWSRSVGCGGTRCRSGAGGIVRPDRRRSSGRMALYHSRHLAPPPSAASGVEGLRRAQAVDLAAQELEAQPGRRHDVFVLVGNDQHIDQQRDDVEIAGVRQAPAATRRTPGSRSESILRNRTLNGREARPGLRVVPLDHARDRRVGLLGARVFEDGQHPLDRAVHRPAHDPPPGHRHRRQVLGQLSAAQQRARSQLA